jgi:hypothetical protein
MTEIEKLRAELDYYKTLYGTGDIASRAYAASVRILEQQVEFLNQFKISDEIKKTTKEDATYGRAEGMWEKLPKLISELHKLKTELGIEYVEKEERIVATSPQSIGTKRLNNVQ